MRWSHTLFTLVIACLLSLPQIAFSADQVNAQTGAPGTPVIVAGEAGAPVGSITIAEVNDPFTGFSPDYPPAAGTRYVVARAIFDADAGQRFDIQPWTIVLQDDQGGLWDSTSFYLPDDALVPPLSGQTLAPDSRVSGLVAFALPEELQPARIFYQPVSSRLVTLAELLPLQAPPLGEPFAITDAEGEQGELTVREVIDPFGDVDISTPAPEGSRLVYAALTYENSGSGRFYAEPYGLLLQDATGELWSPVYVTRTGPTAVIPDLSRTQLAPGDRVTGAVVFAVPLDAPVTGLYFSPTGEEFIALAALAPGTAPAVTTSESATPEATAEPGLVVETDPCTTLQAWLLTESDRISQASDLADASLTATDPALLSDNADELEQLAEAQAAEAVPPGGEASAKALNVTLRALASSSREASRQVEEGGDTSDAVSTLERASARLGAIQAEMVRLTGECAP